LRKAAVGSTPISSTASFIFKRSKGSKKLRFAEPSGAHGPLKILSARLPVGGGCPRGSIDRPVPCRSRRDGAAGCDGEHSQDAAIHLSVHYKPSLVHHDSVQRTYALNDEAAVVVCDYGKAERPQIPFPYYAESVDRTGIPGRRIDDELGHGGEGVECVTKSAPL